MIREALRSLRQSPVFSLTSIGSLGLGIGACASVFAVISATLFAPLPYHDPDRLVELMATVNPSSTRPADYLPPERMLGWVGDEYRSFEAIAGRVSTRVSATRRPAPRSASVDRSSPVTSSGCWGSRRRSGGP